MMDAQRFSLRWDGFRDSVASLLDQLRQQGELLDVTLCCEGHQVRAHRLVLSMCSPYFRQVLKSHPGPQLVLFLRDTPADDLTALLQFMYRGTVDVRQSQLTSFIRTAEMLQIRGLSGDEDKPPPTPPEPPSPSPSASPRPARTSLPPSSPLTKKRRLSGSGSGFGHASGSGCDSPARTSATPPESQPSQSQSTQSRVDDPSHQHADPQSVQPSERALKSEQESYTSYQAEEPYQPWYQDQERPPVKQEPIDLTEDDDMEAALAAIEAGSGPGRHSRPVAGGADSTLGAAGNPVPVTSVATGWPVPAASKGSTLTPTQTQGAAGRTGSDRDSAGGEYRCQECGKVYRSATSLNNHHKQHLGLTVCPLCGKVNSIIPSLRIHLRDVHRLAPAEIYRLIPQRRPTSRKVSSVAPAVSHAAAAASPGVLRAAAAAHAAQAVSAQTSFPTGVPQTSVAGVAAHGVVQGAEGVGDVLSVGDVRHLEGGEEDQESVDVPQPRV